jgi:hypothetical protein
MLKAVDCPLGPKWLQVLMIVMFETPVSVSNSCPIRPWYIWKEEFKILLLVTKNILERF